MNIPQSCHRCRQAIVRALAAWSFSSTHFFSLAERDRELATSFLSDLHLLLEGLKSYRSIVIWFPRKKEPTQLESPSSIFRY
ncbi:hypothetical protein Mp_3g23160 [Marchantia polymorpha subsp. ruderalis]|uniref:Uncharacterized protein n=2 Tax=Marchantia polymorpha TaxID=3197 RepID=A0AAF6B3V3_MARPO|nr:hypothetical protein MARPO_0024s0093 [Marchantia polymorpha]PTQ43588.1 hypothetical protein MARPO_0024s0092 [Marchantia polymorpha]BBN06687.1 hypothetical protein Mp_3g23150 [Marchantia polymorpha subsp. ruderalis]BBN06688.1 hypothetical protein Mp_3g23160 [Marchantia polymorpha subsp. ruderalis]|eukprot:PTQ43586.1 hypothetical protein MARPO_0024s0093 [Marchantia polymorpha]